MEQQLDDMVYERDFKGVWIPKTVWLDPRLNALEKVILTEIDSLDNGERGCWASNKHIAAFCQCSETKVSTAITKLINLGYLYLQSFDGRSRELKSRLSNFERQTFKKCKADSQNLKESNTKRNTTNNTDKKDKKERKTGYDEILSAIAIDDLRELYLEYIKMRKMIKAPMTDRALKLLINKVNDLEPHSIERQKKLLEIAIMNNWKSVYPLKDNDKPQFKQTNAHNYTRRETTPSWMNDDIYTDLTELDDEDQAKADALAEKMKEKYGKDSA